MRERHILCAWPLTPIHIGTGEELTPESFVLNGDSLRTFNSFAALSAATDAERAHYQKLLKGGDFTGAQAHLAKIASRQAKDLDERIPVSSDSKKDLQKVLNGESPDSKGGIRPFIRDGGRPILPGSSLKGAFRTAWIDQAIDGKARTEHVPGKDDTRNTSRFALAINELALDIEKTSALEQDPFRDIAVIDAPIPLGRTRYDRATLGKLAKEQARLDFAGTGGIQMHVERLVSLADGGAVEPFAIEICLAAEALVTARAEVGTRWSQGGEKRIVPKTAVGAAALWVAANRFHADLWLYEQKRFYEDSQTGPLLDRLLEPFGLSSGDDLAGQLDAKGLVLLRVGRYAQFESKAVRLNGRRYGIRAATNNKASGHKPARFMPEGGGGSRTTVKVAKEIAAPFGWLLLALPGKGPRGPVSASLADLAGASSPPRSAAPGGSRTTASPTAGSSALATQFRFRKGDRVVHDDYGDAMVARDVSLADTDMDVDFDGEIDEVRVEGWRRK